MRHNNQFVDDFDMPYSEDLDMEDLELMERILGTFDDDETEGHGKSKPWNIEEIFDEI
jgi:hypothetical protein